MPPLGDAMGLIDRIKRDFNLFQQSNVFLLRKGLRSDIKKLCNPLQEVFPNLGDLDTA